MYTAYMHNRYQHHVRLRRKKSVLKTCRTVWTVRTFQRKGFCKWFRCHLDQSVAGLSFAPAKVMMGFFSIGAVFESHSITGDTILNDLDSTWRKLNSSIIIWHDYPLDSFRKDVKCILMQWNTVLWNTTSPSCVSIVIFPPCQVNNGSDGLESCDICLFAAVSVWLHQCRSALAKAALFLIFFMAEKSPCAMTFMIFMTFMISALLNFFTFFAHSSLGAVKDCTTPFKTLFPSFHGVGHHGCLFILFG